MAWLELVCLLASVLASPGAHLLLRLWVERMPDAEVVPDLQPEVQAVHYLEVFETCQAAEGQQVAAAKPAVCHACCWHLSCQSHHAYRRHLGLSLRLTLAETAV